MVLSGAYPVYLDAYPLGDYCMYGAVPLVEIKRKLLALKRAGQLDRVKMLLLTNCHADSDWLAIWALFSIYQQLAAAKPDCSVNIKNRIQKGALLRPFMIIMRLLEMC